MWIGIFHIFVQCSILTSAKRVLLVCTPISPYFGALGYGVCVLKLVKTTNDDLIRKLKAIRFVLSVAAEALQVDVASVLVQTTF